MSACIILSAGGVPWMVGECRDSADWCHNLFHGHCYDEATKRTCCRTCHAASLVPRSAKQLQIDGMSRPHFTPLPHCLN